MKESTAGARDSGDATVAFASELLLTRRLMTAADRELAHADDVSVRLGVLLTDLAAETLLKAAASRLAVDVDARSNFDSLVKAVVDGGPAVNLNLRYLQGLRRLRNLRNTVQHDGSAPLRDTARGLHADAQKVCARLCNDIFAKDLANLRVIDFVRDEFVGKLLRDAHGHLKEGKFVLTVCWCVAIFDTLLNRWTRFNQKLFELDEGPRDRFARTISTLSANIYLPDLGEFRRATEKAGATVNPLGDVTTTNFGWDDGKSSEQQRADAGFALDFVSGLALRLEAHRTPVADLYVRSDGRP